MPTNPSLPTATTDNAASPNAEQIAVWNGVLVDKYTRFRQVLSDSAAVHGDIALRRHPVAAGQHVLDVGCGFGETSVQLGRAVGPTGSVLGVDVCEPFLEVARQDARAAALVQVTFRRADAQVERFEPTFDLCFSRFGTMFFQDPVAALGNLRAALRTGGRLLVVVWRRLDENEWAVLPRKVVLAHLPAADKTVLGPAPRWPGAGPFSLSKLDVLRGVLKDAGWTGVNIEPIDARVTIGQTLEDALAFALSMGPAGELMREAHEEGEERRPAIERDLAKVLKLHATPRGVLLGAASWCVTAKA